MGCEVSVTNVLADRIIKITLLISVATFLDSTPGPENAPDPAPFTRTSPLGFS
jgi:hypothetical protein